MLAEPRQEIITLRDLPPEILAAREPNHPAGHPMAAAELREKQDIIRALQQCNGNQTQAARMLGCHRNTLCSKIRYFGLSNPF